MFAPTRVWRKWHRKINKKQRRYAVCSALAASALPALVMARGHRVDNALEVPLVVVDAAGDVSKTSDAIALLAKLGAYDDVERCIQSKKIRAGKGKRRNRRYVMRRGPLVVYSNEGAAVKAFRNVPGVETQCVTRLNLLQLAPGGHMGRFIIWMQDAFAQLDSVFGTETTTSEQKHNWKVPTRPMTNADLARIINSEEVQSAIRPKKTQARRSKVKKNPLKNFGKMMQLNPYAMQAKKIATKQKADKAARKARKAAKRKAYDRSRSRAYLASMMTE